MIERGFYVLGSDLVNPKPDRRQRYDWRAETGWKAGREFTVTEEWSPRETRCLAITATWSKWSHHKVYEWEPLFSVLTAVLVPAAVTGETRVLGVLARYNRHNREALDVLVKLVDQGVVSDDQLTAALDEMKAADDAAEDEA